jgi:hypothetical protein
MSIKMWWQNITNEQQEDAQKEGNSWIVWIQSPIRELITLEQWDGLKT